MPSISLIRCTSTTKSTSTSRGKYWKYIVFVLVVSIISIKLSVKTDVTTSRSTQTVEALHVLRVWRRPIVRSSSSTARVTVSIPSNLIQIQQPSASLSLSFLSNLKLANYNEYIDDERDQTNSLLWFRLFDSFEGKPYKNTTATAIANTPGSLFIVDQFRYAVKEKHDFPGYLKDIPASTLLVYKNKAAFAAKDDPLGEDYDLVESKLGQSKEDALIVVIPSSRSMLEYNVNPKRLARWEKLNAVLQSNTRKSKSYDSTAYSSISWYQVKDIFKTSKYVQEEKTIAQEHLDFLETYLKYTTKCFKDFSGREAKRNHLIAPILICVSILFDGDVEIVLEEDLIGNFVKARGRFEFMMKRQDKVVCIVEAKKDDLDQGVAQDLVGCEVAAEIGGLDIVYGIVTSYVQWTFLRSSNEKVEKDECLLIYTDAGPDSSALKMIAQKIYGMLSS